MTQNPLPVYRNGRKFYVSPEDYEQIQTEDRLQRRQNIQKAQHLPVMKSNTIHVRSASKPAYNPLQRTPSNPVDQRTNASRTFQGLLNKIGTNSNRTDFIRPSRSILRKGEIREDRIWLNFMESKQRVEELLRNRSLEKSTSQAETEKEIPTETETKPVTNEQKRPTSLETVRVNSLPTEKKLRRPASKSFLDYPMSPLIPLINTTDQTYGQTNASKLNSYLLQLKQSSIPSSIKSSTSNSPIGSSIIETNYQTSDRNNSPFNYNSMNRMTNELNSSIWTRSMSNISDEDNHLRDRLTSSLVESNSSSLIMFSQAQNIDPLRYHSRDKSHDQNQSSTSHRDTLNELLGRSSFADFSNEKKRVRFADTEGLNLEALPDRFPQKVSSRARLLPKKKHVELNNDGNPAIRPAFTNIYQAVAGISTGHTRRNKLMVNA